MIELSFLLLCLAQMTHLGRTWMRLTVQIRRALESERQRAHLDWRGPQHRPRIRVDRLPCTPFGRQNH